MRYLRLILALSLFLSLISAGVAGVAFMDSGTIAPEKTVEQLAPTVTDKCSAPTLADSDSRVHRPSIQVNVSRHESLVTRSGSSGDTETYSHSQFNVTYSGNATYTKFTATVPRRGTVVSTTGFVRVAEYTYQAENASDGGSISYRYNVTQIQEKTGGVAYYATPEREMFSPVPQIDHRWTTGPQSGSQMACDRLFTDSANYTLTSPREVTASRTAIFIGSSPHTTHSFSVNNSTVTIVSPASITSSNDNMRTQVEKFVKADRALNVDAVAQNVTVFSITGPHDGGGMMARGSVEPTHKTAWVARNAPPEKLGNTWTHEYVHTHQDFRLRTDMRWFSEASATYYATIIPYQCGINDSPTKLTTQLSANMDDISEPSGSGRQLGGYNDTVLSNPDSWGTGAEYSRGAAVLYLLDIQLRESTDGNYTLMDVFQWANNRGQPIGYTQFRTQVVSNSDEDVGLWLDSVVTTDTRITVSNTTPPKTSPTGTALCSMDLNDREFDFTSETDVSEEVETPARVPSEGRNLP